MIKLAEGPGVARETDSNWRLRLILPEMLRDNLQTNKQTYIYIPIPEIYIKIHLFLYCNVHIVVQPPMNFAIMIAFICK